MSHNMEEDEEVISFGAKITDSGIHPVAEILDNLKHDDLSLRLSSLKRLHTIAIALGPDRTTNDLIPFLTGLAADEEDEVLLVMAEELPKLIECGQEGVKSAHALLTVLEILLQAEETVVRQQAISSTQLVLNALSDAQIESHMWPLWCRLAQASFFVSKASAATLAADLSPRLSAKARGELRKAFTQQICLDECPIVRRAAAPSLARLVTQSKTEERVLLNELWILFQGLADDSQDSVRLLAVEVALAFGEALPVKAINEQLLPITLKLTTDRSWRVRYLIGASFTGLTERIFAHAPSGKVDALGLFCALLADSEAEVRTAAARQLSSTCAHFPAPEFQARILPVLRQLASDPSVSVRSAVATQLNPLSAIAGAELASASLFPLYTHFFADESSQVRLNAVSKMDVVCGVMGVERVAASILPAIVHLAEDKQWRVREAVIDHLPTLSQHLGEKFFNDNLVKICLDLLCDQVYAVRLSAIKNIRNLIEAFGVEWCRERLLSPALTHLTTSSNYLRRLGVPKLIVEWTPLGDEKLLWDLSIPALKALATDSVANVRLSVAKAIGKLATEKGLIGELSGVLQLLAQDGDDDVRFYAQQIMN